MKYSTFSEYALTAILVVVIDDCAPALIGISNDLVDFIGARIPVQSHLGSEWSESQAQLIDRLVHAPLEAWQVALRLGEHLHKNYDLLVLFVNGLESRDHAIAESLEALTFKTS